MTDMTLPKTFDPHFHPQEIVLVVTSLTDRIAHITWYKWGYKGETFTDWMLITNITDHILSVADCQKRFGGLPPTYQR